jgi:adenosylmethionine-8-amino-7-oxononanoate aminotransferase
MSNVGHGRREIVRAIADQAERLSYYSLFGAPRTAPPSSSLEAARRSHRARGHDAGVLRHRGSEAVESAFKLARQYWKLVGEPERTSSSRWRRAYHGVGYGGLIRQRHALLPPDVRAADAGFFQVETPYLYRNPFTDDPRSWPRPAP